MTSATYTVEIDFDKDGTYGHANSDVSSYIRDMQWQNGMGNSEQEFSPPATLRLTLDNSAGDFNPDESGAAFYGLFKKGMLVRIKANFASTDYTLYIGKIRDLPRIDVNTYSDQAVMLTASGYMEELLKAEFAPTLQTDVTTDAALSEVFTSGVLAFPYTSSYWILESSTASELDATTILLDPSVAYSFETGKQTLAYAGDNSGSENTVRAQQYCRDVVAAEMGGRFWYNTRTGKFVFHNRHHDINPTSQATIDQDDYEDAAYVHQGTIFNDVTVHYYPREVGGAGSVIWSSSSAVTLARGEVKTITARYQDPNLDNVKIAALDYIAPKRGVDFIANTAEDGSGSNLTTRVVMSVEFAAQSATVTISNDARRRVYFTTLQLRATPLYSYQRQSVNKRETESITSYDVQPEQRTLKYVDNEDDAASYAGVLIGQYKTPITRYESITFNLNKTSTRMTNGLNLTVGDAITITFSDIEHSNLYIIVGERHRVRAGGEHEHEVIWILKPADNVIYWQLESDGYTELDETTILAF